MHRIECNVRTFLKQTQTCSNQNRLSSNNHVALLHFYDSSLILSQPIKPYIICLDALLYE